jgi:hypothetical protein
VHSLAVYDFIVDVMRGVPPGARRRPALDAPLAVWERVIAFEGCGARADRAMSLAGHYADAPPRLRRLLRESTSTALRNAALAQHGLGELAALAHGAGVRVLALKGAARLLSGELAGTRTLSDIDLLIPGADAERFHSLLQRELGYRWSGQPYPHHLPALTRPGSLGIEIHRRLTATELDLDDEMLRGTRVVELDGHPIEIPSHTNMVLHTLEHAARMNWMVHYRLRDILDVASLITPDVRDADIGAYTDRSTLRVPFEVLLSAAHDLNARAPLRRPSAWRTVRRVARTRLALAAVPRARTTANRVFRYASVVAEGSPRAMLRAGASLLRRVGGAALPIAALIFAACSETTRPDPLEVTRFLFVSDSGGTSGIYLFDNGEVTRLSAADHEDDQPHGAAGRVVFVSRRDGNTEIYIGDAALANQMRLTNESSADTEPALDPAGTTIAFVSSRSGTPRLWLMDATGADPRPLDTGSETFTPEGAPAWSPSGDRLAFTSARTNTSQVFVLNTATGQVTQLSHESGGAFAPAWSDDGRSVFYVPFVGEPRVMRIDSEGGEPGVFGTGDESLGDPACWGDVCLVAAGADAGDGDIIAVRAGHPVETVLARSHNDRRPAFLVP